LTKFKDVETGKVDDFKTYDILIHIAYQYPDILFTKLADRLHNWETIGAMPAKKKAEYINEALGDILEEPKEVRVECAKIINGEGYDNRVKGFLSRLAEEVKVV